MSNEEDVIDFITATLAIKSRESFSAYQLQSEYKESNPGFIPYRELGYKTLHDLLKKYPNKIHVQQDDNNEIRYRAVIDDKLYDLNKLVTGQKKTKKKKSKMTVSKHKHQYKHASNPIFSNYKKPTTSNVFGTKQPQNINNFNNKNQEINQKQSRVQTTMQNIVHRSVNLACIQNNKIEEKRKMSVLKSNTVEIEKSKLSIDKKKSLKNDIENLWIQNASYFLKEHLITISYIETCGKIFIRLIGEHFSVNYENMMKRLSTQNLTQQETFEIDSICIGFDETDSRYHRLQITKLEGNKILCFFVDLGKTKYFSKNQLFAIQEEHLVCKFQAIQVQIADFSKFENNEHIRKCMKKELVGKFFLARRTENLVNSALKIEIFNEKNECVNKMFFAEFEQFISFKPKINECFSGYITYLDEEANVAHLQLHGSLKEKFDIRMEEMNKYFNKVNASVTDEEYFSKNINELYLHLCFARYSLDSNWYRVKLLRKFNEDSVLVHYIDFGNKETVKLKDLRQICNQFEDFKYFPPQALSVTIYTKNNIDVSILNTLFFDNRLTDFRVIQINSARMPMVEITKVHESLFAPSETASVQNESLTEDKDEIAEIILNNLRDTDLPWTCSVYVSYVNSPFDFVINLESLKNDYLAMKDKMMQFYKKNSEKYLVKNPRKEHVYICVNENQECSRVMFVDFVIDDLARVYNIDLGNYDAVSLNSLHFITKRFLKVKPLAIKAKLANINSSYWSDEAKSYFLSLTFQNTFTANMVNFDVNTNFFTITLTSGTSGSIGQLIINKGFAKATQ